MQKNIIHYSVLMALATIPMTLHANADTNEATLTPVKVTGKTQRNTIDNTSFNSSSISNSDINDPSVVDIADAFAKQTSISLELDASGNTRYLNIRGLGENYTDVTIDGIKKPSYFTYGHGFYNSGEFNSFETDTLKQIDIIKGRNSPKQRGGALAGSINMRTYNPSDLVNAEKPYYASFKSGYASKNRSWGNTLTGAFSSNNFSGMLIYTHRNAHELENKGTDVNKTKNDFADIKQDNILAKGEVKLDKGSLILTGEYFSMRKRETPRYQNPINIVPPIDQPVKRTRFSLEGNFEDVLGLDSLKTQLSYQKTKNTNGYYSMTRQFYLGKFKQDYLGLTVDAVKTIHSGSLNQTLLFGLGWERTKFDFTRVRTRLNQRERPTPITVRNTFYAYAKDNLTFSNGLVLSLGLRLEHQRHTSKIDDLYRQNTAATFQGFVPKGSKTSVLPNLGIMMPLTESTQLFASYSLGQKNADDVNFASYDHGFFVGIPNPDLKDEKSNNVELGLIYEPSDNIKLKLNGFYTQYRDFIGGQMTTYNGRTAYMPYNVGKAKTYGLEFESNVAINDNFSSRVGFTWMKGSEQAKDVATGVYNKSTPMPRVVPFSAFVGVTYQKADKWGVNVDWKLSSKGVKVPGKNKLRTSGYGIVDLTAWVKPVKGLTISGGIYNLFDKTYMLASDINAASTKDYYGRSINFEPYTRPGRNVAVNLKYEY